MCLHQTAWLVLLQATTGEANCGEALTTLTCECDLRLGYFSFYTSIASPVKKWKLTTEDPVL